MKKIKLIALDIDGTLATSYYTILPETLKAMQECHEKGIEVVLCSGRSLPEMGPFLEYLPFIRYVIVGNGTRVYDLQKEKRLYQNVFDSSILVDISNEIKDIPHLFEYYTDEKVFAEANGLENLADYGLDVYRDFFLETRTPILNIIEYLKNNPTKIEKANFHFKNVEDQRKVLELAKKYECSPTTSFHDNVEIGAKDANKAKGLNFLAEHLDISADEILAMGDNINDIEMLQYAGIGIAMGNAVPELKAVADDVTETNNNDGIAISLHKYILDK